jgi:hypothetical protein
MGSGGQHWISPSEMDAFRNPTWLRCDSLYHLAALDRVTERPMLIHECHRVKRIVGNAELFGQSLRQR